MQMMTMTMTMIIDSLVPTAVHVASIWEEDPSFYRLSAQNTIAFSPYTDNLAPLCNITLPKERHMGLSGFEKSASKKWRVGGINSTLLSPPGTTPSAPPN